MVEKDPWFFEERAFWFASLVLTKRNDVTVRAHAGTDMAVEIVAEIRSEAGSTPRRFGVQLVAYMDLPGIPNADDRVLWHAPGNHAEGQLPICVFVIGVRKPEGIYRWVVEPVVENGKARLDRRVRSRREVQSSWHALDQAGVARLIDQVNAWYDALHEGATPQGRDRRSNRGL